MTIFRLLLRLYPRRFRLAYESEMEAMFLGRLRRARARGRATFAGTLARAYFDLIAGAAAERLTRESPVESGDSMLRVMTRDLAVAARTLVRQRGFAATVVLTLALGIGAATAIVSLIDATILRPLPYPQPDRLVALTEHSERFGKAQFAPAFLRDFREQLTRYESIAAFTSTWEVALTGAGEARSVPAAFVSDGLLELFGAQPVSGRLLSAADEQAGARVAILSAGLWDRIFGRGTPLAGQLLRINDEPFSVIGILDGDFRMPITTSVMVASHDTAQLFLPLSANPLASLRTIPFANIVGRLKHDATVDMAAEEFERLPAVLSRRYREVSPDARYQATALESLVSEPVRRPLLALLLGVSVLLLIACANVANLMLARSASRADELAVRAALGASRGRLMNQIFAESLVLATAGTALGVLVAWSAIASMPALALGDLPPSAVIEMNGRVLAIAVFAGLFATCTVAIVPALFASRSGLSSTVRSGRSVEGRGRGARNALVLVEVALAVVLLVSAGLLARSFWKLTRVDPGFRADRVLANGVAMPGSRYPTADSRRAFVGRVLERIGALPGVTTAAAVNRLPLEGANVIVGVEIEGQPQPDGPVLMDRRVVTDAYFQALGIRVLAGRGIGTEDRAGSADPIVIVNDAVRRRFWPDAGALDSRLRFMLRSGPGPWLRIVGVVGDIRHHGLDQPAQPEVYVPYAQAPVESMVFLARTAADPRPLAASVRRIIQAIDPEAPVRQVLAADLLDASVAEPRLRAALFNAFAVAALLLSALGIYGVVSHAVALRTREIGVRVALGATRGRILALVMRSGFRMVAAGAVAGLAGAAVATRALRGLLFGVPALDPWTFIGVTAVLLLVALVAILIPARRAVQLDPIRALRMD